MSQKTKFVNARVEALLHELSVFGATQTSLLMQLVEATGKTPTVGTQPFPDAPVGDMKAFQQPEVKNNNNPLGAT